MKKLILILGALSMAPASGMEFLRFLFSKEPKQLPIYRFKIKEEVWHHENEEGLFSWIRVAMNRNNFYDGALDMYSDDAKEIWIIDRMLLFGLKDAQGKERAERQLLMAAIILAKREKSKQLVYYPQPDRIENIESMGAECSYPAQFGNKRCARCVFEVTKDIFKY